MAKATGVAAAAVDEVAVAPPTQTGEVKHNPTGASFSSNGAAGIKMKPTEAKSKAEPDATAPVKSEPAPATVETDAEAAPVKPEGNCPFTSKSDASQSKTKKTPQFAAKPLQDKLPDKIVDKLPPAVDEEARLRETLYKKKLLQKLKRKKSGEGTDLDGGSGGDGDGVKREDNDKSDGRHHNDISNRRSTKKRRRRNRNESHHMDNSGGGGRAVMDSRSYYGGGRGRYDDRGGYYDDRRRDYHRRGRRDDWDNTRRGGRRGGDNGRDPYGWSSRDNTRGGRRGRSRSSVSSRSYSRSSSRSSYSSRSRSGSRSYSDSSSRSRSYSRSVSRSRSDSPEGRKRSDRSGDSKKKGRSADEQSHRSGDGKNKKARSGGEREHQNEQVDELTKDQRTIFISQLVMKAEERDIRRYFQRKILNGHRGCVRDVILLRDKRTGRHKGCAYVELANLSDVEKALDASGKTPDFQKFPILVKSSTLPSTPGGTVEGAVILAVAGGMTVDGKRVESQKVYLGNVDRMVTQAQLYALFSQFGPLEKVLLQMDPTTGASRGFAFLSYRDPKDANLAIQTMIGQLLAGKPLETKK
eukprot:g11813.t1.1.5e17418b g11813  g11813.t1 contig6:632223-634208(-)